MNRQLYLAALELAEFVRGVQPNASCLRNFERLNLAAQGDERPYADELALVYADMADYVGECQRVGVPPNWALHREIHGYQ